MLIALLVLVVLVVVIGMVANPLGFQPATLFEVKSEEEREAVKVSF